MKSERKNFGFREDAINYVRRKGFRYVDSFGWCHREGFIAIVEHTGRNGNPWALTIYEGAVPTIPLGEGIPRQVRRDKRSIYTRATLAAKNLEEALRDLAPFLADYQSMVAAWEDDELQEVILELRTELAVISMKRIQEMLEVFNNLPEELEK